MYTCLFCHNMATNFVKVCKNSCKRTNSKSLTCNSHLYIGVFFRMLMSTFKKGNVEFTNTYNTHLYIFNLQ